MKKLYEIHDLTTGEILADNLEFDDMPELFGAYQDFYPNHEIVVCYRVDGYIKTSPYFVNASLQRQQEFTTQWLNLIEENLCNVY